MMWATSGFSTVANRYVWGLDDLRRLYLAGYGSTYYASINTQQASQGSGWGRLLTEEAVKSNSYYSVSQKKISVH
ncbi:hypothetical protein PG987_014545 [Apiospora arundinis]